MSTEPKQDLSKAERLIHVAFTTYRGIVATASHYGVRIEERGNWDNRNHDTRYFSYEKNDHETVESVVMDAKRVIEERYDHGYPFSVAVDTRHFMVNDGQTVADFLKRDLNSFY